VTTQIPPFMGDFSDDDIRWVIRNGVQLQIPAGEAIIREGTTPIEFFVILKGTFVVSSGQLAVPLLRRLGPGEIAGELSYIHRRPAGATVTAEVDSVVLSIRREQLDRKIAEDAGFAGRFHKVVSEFTVDRLYGWRASHGAGPSAAEEDPQTSERIRKLIEDMLSGRFDSLDVGGREGAGGTGGKGGKDGKDGRKGRDGKKDGGGGKGGGDFEDGGGGKDGDGKDGEDD
jgi:CRP/FNR family transcriptional regulator, cyclic AMP receptor protein